MIIFHYLWIGVVLVTMISLLVAAHEFGHYLFARRFNMGVEEFAVGFGKPILTVWKRLTYQIPLRPGQDPMLDKTSEGSALEGGNKEVERRLVDDGAAIEETTDFTIRPWPVGGFVRIKGMMPEEDGSETRVPGGFYSKPPWQRLAVLFAGPLFSVLAGFLVLVPVLMIWGIDKPVNEPVIGRMDLNNPSPAGRAGLKPGDRILAVQGQPTQTFYDFLKVVRSSPDVPLPVRYQRDGKTLETTLTPAKDKSPTMVLGPDLVPTPDMAIQGRIGVNPKVSKQPLPLIPAMAEAAIQPVKIVQGLVGIFAKPDRFAQQVGGPITIAQYTGQAMEGGIDYVLYLAAMLSISVGIMNLLPIPPLDGGQMVIAFAEMVRGGRRLSIQMQNLANLVGVAMVFALMLGAFTVDIKRRIDAPRKEAEYKAQMEGKK